MLGVNTILFSLYTVLALNCIFTMSSLQLDDIRKGSENELADDLIQLLGIFNNSQLIHLFLADNLEDQEDSRLEEFILKNWQTIITEPKTFDTIPNILKSRPDTVIIILYKYYELQHIQHIQSILKSYVMSWNTEAKVLIVAQMECCHHHSSIYKLIIGTLNLFWKINTFRVAIAFGHNNTFTMYSSAPFSKLYSTCRNISNPRQIQTISLNKTELHMLKISGYENRQPTNFLGCPIIANTFPLTPYSVGENTTDGKYIFKRGLEVQLILLMAELANFSLKIESTPYYKITKGFDAILPNGSRIGIIWDLLSFKIDIGFAGAIPSSDDLQSYLLDLSYTTFFGSMSMYVPDPEIVPSWKLVLNTFTLFTWFSVGLMFFVLILLYYLINVLVPNPERLPINLTMVAITLGVAIRQPKLSHIRILLLAWSIFSLNITIMFNTKLFSVLTNRPIQPGIRNAADMKKTGFRLCVQETYKRFYTNKTDGAMRYLLEHAMICDDMEKAIKDLLEKRNFSILAKDDYFSFLVDEKRAKIHHLKKTFVTYPVTMYLSKGCVITRPFNRFVLQVSQSGIATNWLRDIRWHEKTKIQSKETVCGGNKGVLLNQDDFTWIYIVYVIGLVFAFFCFVVELTFYNQ